MRGLPDDEAQLMDPTVLVFRSINSDDFFGVIDDDFCVRFFVSWFNFGNCFSIYVLKLEFVQPISTIRTLLGSLHYFNGRIVWDVKGKQVLVIYALSSKHGRLEAI